jgi:hypothetical protein
LVEQARRQFNYQKTNKKNFIVRNKDDSNYADDGHKEQYQMSHIGQMQEVEWWHNWEQPVSKPYLPTDQFCHQPEQAGDTEYCVCNSMSRHVVRNHKTALNGMEDKPFVLSLPIYPICPPNFIDSGIGMALTCRSINFDDASKQKYDIFVLFIKQLIS